MTDKYQELSEALAKGPTPGPWVSSQECVDPEWFIVTAEAAAAPIIANVNADSRQTANAAYIATASPATITALLAERDALRDALANLLDSLSMDDEEGLMEHVEPVIVARAALAGDHIHGATKMLAPAWVSVDDGLPAKASP